MGWGWACDSFLGLDPIDSCVAVLSEAFAEVGQRRRLYDWLRESGNELGGSGATCGSPIFLARAAFD